MGQEDSIRDLVAAYRALPAVKFRQITERQSSSQPVVFRSGVHAGKTYLYAVNDAPFRVTAKLRVTASANCRLDELTGMRKINALKPDKDGGLVWEVQLEPYDLVAVQLNDADVQLARPEATWPNDIESTLAMEIRKLSARAAALRNSPAISVLDNAEFEKQSEKNTAIPGWAGTSREGVTIAIDPKRAHGGKQSVKIRSEGPIACLASQPIPAPATGRLSMAVWLRIESPDRQPPLRLALEGKWNGTDYYRYAQVGRAADGGMSNSPLGTEWEQYIFQVDDLPLTGLSPLRMRFDLMGEGEVWVDDVQLYNLAFSNPEIVELMKLIALLDYKLQCGNVGDCSRLLDGYWPRFLVENVPLPATLIAKQPPSKKPAPEKQPNEPTERTGLMDKVKNIIPESMRF
jgi:hypothetical protein